MKILMLSLNTFPYPPTYGGAEIRTFNLLKHLQAQHEVTLLTHCQRPVTTAEIDALRHEVTHLEILPSPPQPQPARSLSGLLQQAGRFGRFLTTSTPPSVAYRYVPAVQDWVDRAVASQKYDVVVCEHSVNEIYVRPHVRAQLRTVVDIHSSVYGWVRNHLEQGATEKPWRDRLYLPLLARYEQRYCRKFSRLVVTTPDDRHQILKLVPEASVDIIANGVDLAAFPYRHQDPGGENLIFIGAMDASHNIDAACFFAQQVFPQIRQRYPAATLSLVGARPVARVQALAELPGVIVTGRVPSMVEYLHQATVCVVPLRAGLGIKNKTLEPMAAGVPIVGSDRGLEGLSVDQPLRALRANTPAAYIAAIDRLFADAALRRSLSQNARAMIEADYTWEKAGQKYERVLSS
ncbi:glycosyltransferase family 4 protein [Almyronema epifaneia]|uniref:Glycosyltransferase family 4 protein n=1 Tax=Almyronema epifaneia S1 TaxID=2991925 RepID=A0ABW6IJC8_9CYAN